MNIKKYKLYLIDLDGTIYNGEKKIKFADQFVDYLNKTKTDYLFLTNNSTIKNRPKWGDFLWMVFYNYL